jgi:uncharacterized membrane protein YjdF
MASLRIRGWTRTLSGTKLIIPTTSHEGIKVLGQFVFLFFFASILPVDCLVELMWKSLKRYSTAPFIKFVIFHLCTARAINACLTSLSAGSFDMKNVILCISAINLLLLFVYCCLTCCQAQTTCFY